MGISFDVASLEKELKGKNLLSGLLFFEEIGSTNDYAKNNVYDDDTLVLTDHQLSGRGRYSRVWESAKGENLSFSLVKFFDINIDDLQLVNFYTSYIIFSSIKNLLPPDTAKGLCLKWPNDILLNGKKVCGVLIEIRNINSSRKKFIIGAGINVNFKELPSSVAEKATSLFIETGSEIGREELLSLIIREFYANLELVNDRDKLLSLWKENFDFMGRSIKFKKSCDDDENPVEILDISNDGGLIVRMDDGTQRTYYSGEISIIL